MKKNIVAIIAIPCILLSLCACGTTQMTMDVAIEGGSESPNEAIISYYSALSSKDFSTLINVSASMNKSCVQNTISNYNEENYQSGIEAMKKSVNADFDNISITVSVGESSTYEANSTECKSFIEEYEGICSGLNKIQAYAVITTSLTFSDGESKHTEDKEEKCIKIQDRWFVFDYSAEEPSDSENNSEDISVTIKGGGTSVEDTISKYYKAISNKDAASLADVLLMLNATAYEAITGTVDTQHDANINALETELKADADTVTLTPTVTNSTTHQIGSSEMDAFISSKDFIVRTTQIKAYATATVSLTITIPGDSDTYTDSATITCVQINESWFVLNE